MHSKLTSPRLPSPGVSEDDLGRLAAVQLQVVSLGPFLHVGELHMPGRLITIKDTKST